MKKQKTGKKKMKWILIPVCALILCAGLCLASRFISAHTYDGSGMANDARLVSVSYSESGDEYGRSTSYWLKDGLLTYNHNEGTAGGSVKKSCSTGEDLEQALEDIVRQYDIRAWKDLPDSDLMALDGSSVSLTLEFADSTIVRLGDRYEMPDGAWSAVKEITDCLDACLNP